MGVTSYYSFGGEIIGEETGGVRRDYLTDALGSVTATVTGAGVVENTYRYKPYGEQLAKTGTGSDPKFLWNGKSGYVAMVKRFAEFYVRHRYFSSSLSRWNTVDPLGIRGGDLNYYRYSINNSISLNDPSGLQLGDIPWPFPPNKDVDKYLEDRCTDLPIDGLTTCDISKGKPVSGICTRGENRPCELSKCVRAHEDRHQKSHKDCCTYASLSKDPKRQEKYFQWVSSNNAAFECNALQADENCCKNMPQNSQVKDYCKETEFCRKMCCAEAMSKKPVSWPCPFNKDGSPVPGWDKRPRITEAKGCQSRCQEEIRRRIGAHLW